ncbi:MAG: nuclear transport factor 2 family protein [Clostridia bacterium]|nr:nuclear transport factor 2 family protein [Clostridia bacterium]
MRRTLERWFAAWIERDASVINDVFAGKIVYSECYGPEYRGIGQIHRWFDEWNRKGRVLEWTIRESYCDGDTIIAVWYFCCEYEGNTAGFDGVTIARFGAEGKITSLREFQSDPKHVFPYGKELC